MDITWIVTLCPSFFKVLDNAYSSNNPQPQAAPSKSQRGKILAVLLVVVVVLVSGIFVGLFLANNQSQSRTTVQSSTPSYVVQLSGFDLQAVYSGSESGYFGPPSQAQTQISPFTLLGGQQYTQPCNRYTTETADAQLTLLIQLLLAHLDLR